MRLRDTAFHLMGIGALPKNKRDRLEAISSCATSALNAEIDRHPLPHNGVSKINVYGFCNADAPELAERLPEHVSSVMAVPTRVDLDALAGLDVDRQLGYLFGLHVQALLALHTHHSWSLAELRECISEAETNGLSARYKCRKRDPSRRFTASLVGTVGPEATLVEFFLTAEPSGEVVAHDSRVIMSDYWDLTKFAKTIKWNGSAAHVISARGSLYHPVKWSLVAGG